MFENFFKTDERTQLTQIFEKRNRDHWKKKVPKGKSYPYSIHDPYEIFGVNSGYEKLYLVGDNWVNSPQKPIAIAIGFNDWKFGFIADYLPEFRVAFAPRKLVNYKLITIFSQLVVKPKLAVVWGYNESKGLNRYLKYKKIDVWRVEDGFIRSSEIGASGATPYSLVIDKSGLYYNSAQPSDIETILNTYEFDSKDELQSQAEDLLKLIVDFKITKYNPPVVFHDTSLKLRKRVLVIGQVDNDASIRYGNPNGWTMEDMVRLAKHENPESEILYRPHPEIYKGYQSTGFKKDNVEFFAKVISPEEHIIELIERVDHVYTITSLTGLEALLRGKKVTVLGKPFYAGWGLTDDRSSFETNRRIRKLKLWELFVATYLIYPRYLKNKVVNEEGSIDKSSLLAVIGRIESEKTQLINSFIKKEENVSNVPQIQLAHALYSKDLKNINSRVLSQVYDTKPSYFNELLTLILVSFSDKDKSRESILKSIRCFIDYESFNRVLLILNKFYPGKYLVSQLGWLLSEKMEFNEAYNNLSNYKYLDYESEVTIKIPPEYFEDLFTISMASKNFDEAKRALSNLVLQGDFEIYSLLRKGVAISNFTFDFSSASSFSQLLSNIDVFYANRVGVLENFRASIHNEDRLNKVLKLCFDITTYKPDKIFYTNFLISNLNDKFLEKTIQSALVKSLRLDNEISVRKVNSFIAAELFEEAEDTAKKLIINSSKNTESNIIVYSQALSYNNKYLLAIQIIEDYIRTIGISKATATEAMRLYVLNSQYAKSLSILNICVSKGIEIGEMHQRKSYFGNRLVGQAFKTFKHLNLAYLLSIYFENKYYNDLYLIKDKDSIFFISIFGPGDEIRFASIYKKIKLSVKSTDIQIYLYLVVQD